MTPIPVQLREDLSLSRAQVALLTTLVTALGVFVGHPVRPLPPHRMLVAGLMVMGPAGLFCARSDSFGAMLGGRLVEGVGPCPPAVGVVGLVLLRIAVRQPSYGRTTVKEAA